MQYYRLAAMAMQGLAAYYGSSDDRGAELARRSYAVADAMLAARGKESGHVGK